MSRYDVLSICFSFQCLARDDWNICMFLATLEFTLLFMFSVYLPLQIHIKYYYRVYVIFATYLIFSSND